MQTALEYYVYVYIDPRNFEEFYYGKGKGNRKNAHLSDDTDSEKSRRIKLINDQGFKPIIKVIAKNLAEEEAFLIEKTLIWKLGRNLTNKSSGHFADKFRPHDTFHLDLSGFDFKNGYYYVNVGECDVRCWEDCKQYGFIAAGQDPKWSNPLRMFEPGDVIAAYLKNHGFVGIGKVLAKATKVLDFRYEEKSLKDVPLIIPNIFKNSDNDKSEYLIRVEWIKAVDRKEAKWKRNGGLFTTQLIKASLQSQPGTVDFLQKEFDIKFSDLLLTE